MYGSLATLAKIGASRWFTTTILTGPLPTSYIIPGNCCVKCGVTAKDVRLFYWPIETDAKNATSGAATMITTSIPSGLISDGFTLSVKSNTELPQADCTLAHLHPYT